MWPLSAPVCRHWATKCFWLRLPMARVSQSDTGIVTSAMTASSGEIDEHHDHDADDREQAR